VTSIDGLFSYCYSVFGTSSIIM